MDDLVDAYGDRVYRFVSRMVGPLWAEDLTQEAFIRMMQVRGEPSPAWVFTVARNVCLNHLKRKKIEAAKIRLIDPAQAAATPPEHLERAERREKLLAEVSRLPVERKQVFLLREEGRLTFREIAEMLGVPLGTVLGRMRDAVEDLKKKLQESVSRELSRVC